MNLPNKCAQCGKTRSVLIGGKCLRCYYPGEEE